MTKQTINIGTTSNDKSGDPLRTAFAKVNANFTELYATTAAQVPTQTGNNGKYLTTNGSALSWVNLPADVDNYVTLSTTGQTITDTTGGTNYTLKIASGTTGAVFGIGTGTDGYGIANDSLNHNASGYVPYNATASTISFNIPGYVGSLTINETGVVRVANGITIGGVTQTTAWQGITNALPSQTSNANKYLKTDGAGNLSWDIVSVTPSTMADSSATFKLQAASNRVITSTGIRYELFNGSKFGEDNSSTAVLSSMTSGKLVLRTTNSLLTTRDFEFSDAGNLTLPLGGNIYTNGGVAYNSWANITGKIVAGVDYLAPPSGTSILKANSGGALINATAGTDYLAPPSGTSILKANSGGALINATAGTDYLAPPSGTNILKANSGGALANAVAGVDYLVPGSAYGTPSSLTLTNASGLPLSGLTGINSNISTFLANPTSANLAGAISDETGSNSIVFSSNPQISSSITTDSVSFNLLDSTATTINFGRAATSIVMGNSSGNGTTNVQNNLAINGGLTRSSNFSAPAWGLNGIGLNMQGVTFTDTTSTGTIASTALYSILTPTIAASNTTTYTNAYTLYVGGNPTSGTNVTQGSSWAAFFGGPINSAGVTSTGTLALTGSTTSTVSLGTSVTSATITIGGGSGTGNINIAPSTTSQTVQLGYGATAAAATLAINIGTGAAASTGTKNINIGTAGLSGSTTNISIGSAVSGALGATTVNNYLVHGINAAVTAAGNAVQSTATALVKDINILTTVTAGSATGVALPTGVAGMIIYIYNTTATAANVYPVNGGTAQINALGANAAYSLAGTTGARFVCASATQWYTV